MYYPTKNRARGISIKKVPIELTRPTKSNQIWLKGQYHFSEIIEQINEQIKNFAPVEKLSIPIDKKWGNFISCPEELPDLASKIGEFEELNSNIKPVLKITNQREGGHTQTCLEVSNLL